MSLTSKQIETISVSAIMNSISVSEYLQPFIPDGDREPIWDGNIYLYENSDHNNNTLKGRVPVQVKGKVSKDFSKDEISYPVEIPVLQSFLRDGGGIFFVVYIDCQKDRRKIYYLELTPIRTRCLLAEAKKESKSIKLKPFPTDNDQKANIFFNCWQHCKKQASFYDAELLSINELQSQGMLESLTIPLTVVGKAKNPLNTLIGNEIYVYANIKGGAIPQPLEILPQNIRTHAEIDAVISVNGKVFYNNFHITKSEKNIKYVFGKSFSVLTTLENTGITINYSNSDDVRVLSKDLDFMLSFLESGGFEIDNKRIPFESEHADFTNFDIDHQKAVLEFAKKATSVLDIFGCHKTLLFSSLDDESVRNLDRLYYSLIKNQSIDGLKENLPLICFMKVGNLNFIIILHKDKNNPKTYKIENFFGSKIIVAYDGENEEKIPVSQYIILKPDDMLKADNIRWELFLTSFKEVEKHSKTFEIANQFLLDLLNTYDRCGDKNILNTAKDFAEWISTAPDNEMPNAVTTLNLMQVIKRIRKLDENEQKLLYMIVSEKNTPTPSMVGAYLLLEQQILAEIYFNKMKFDEQEQFKKYPIYHFWKKEELNNGQT